MINMRMEGLLVASDGFRSGLLSVYFYLMLSVYFEGQGEEAWLTENRLCRGDTVAFKKRISLSLERN